MVMAFAFFFPQGLISSVLSVQSMLLYDAEAANLITTNNYSAAAVAYKLLPFSHDVNKLFHGACQFIAFLLSTT
tara:strand:- start:1529 stop:1750 length:222 start_codon:yes stop_codon:yes gene_type:complete